MSANRKHRKMDDQIFHAHYQATAWYVEIIIKAETVSGFHKMHLNEVLAREKVVIVISQENAALINKYLLMKMMRAILKY